MAHATSFKRRVRLRDLQLVSIAFVSIAGVASAHAASDEPDRCIVADRAIGCVNERSATELMTPRKNNDSVRTLVRQKLQSGQCRLFNYGERVALVSATGNERTEVRRIGDHTTWWLPSSWTQPANQCEADASSATLFAKLGLPNPHNAVPGSRDLWRLPDSPTDENSGRSDYAYRDEPWDPAENTDTHVTRDQADLPLQSRDEDLRGRRATRIEYEREDSRFRSAIRPERYGPDDAFGQDAPAPQHRPLRSSSYARTRRPPRAPVQGSCTSGVIVTDEDIDPCEELRR